MDATRTYKNNRLTEVDIKTKHSPRVGLLQQSPTGDHGGFSMDMKLGLGAKAKMALTDSLGRLNNKFRLGTFLGVVQNQSLWSNSEMRVWMSVLFVGVVCLYGNQVALPMTVMEVEKQLTWQRKDTALLLSSFYWGYLLSQIVGHRVLERFGAGVVMYLTAVVWSLGVICISYAAYVSMALAVIIRVLTGMAQGLHYPALINLLVHRAPETGKAFYFSMLNTGAYVGYAVTGTLSSILLIDHGLNWYYLSMVTGVAGLVWAIGLRALTLHSLQNHKTRYKLSDNKRHTTLSTSSSSEGAAVNGASVTGAGLKSGGATLGIGGATRESSRDRLKLEVHPSSMMTSCSQLPLRNLVRKPPILALLAAYFSASLLLHHMTCWNSIYFNDLYPDSKDQAWFYNVLPWVAMAVGSAVSSWIAQWMTSHNISLTVTRNLFTSLCLSGSSFFLILLAISGHTKDVHFSLTIFFNLFTFLFAGCFSAGPLANLFDLLTPSQVGILFAVVNTVGTIPGIFGVYLTGSIVQATSSWTLVFTILIITNVLGTLIYLAFSSGKRLQTSENS